MKQYEVDVWISLIMQFYTHPYTTKPKEQTPMYITLNQIEQYLAKTVGQERRNQNQQNGRNSDELALDNDINGFGGELAVARAINAYPDFTIMPHRRGYDLTKIENGKEYTVDVKTTRSNPGSLMAKRWKKVDDCSLYVLVHGKLPRYEIQGWVWSRELINDSNLMDNGYGKHYYMERSQLRNWRV